MTEILTVYTGGTICSFETGECRSLDTSRAKRLIESKFLDNKGQFGIDNEIIFKDSELDEQTLSENMTTDKLMRIVNHIKSFDLSKFQGVIVLHGTDSLAYTASLFSFVFSELEIPIMLVSGHKPPNEDGTNANENFGTAVKLIADGIAPNVYVPYENTNGEMWLHLGATLMQCPNFSDDFENADNNKKFLIGDREILKKCKKYSDARNPVDLIIKKGKSVLNIFPYTGLDYKRISLRKIGAVVHGTYHSGTICVERNGSYEKYGRSSVLSLADKCRKKNIPIFAAPSKLGEEQYSSVFDAVKYGGIIPLYMTTESAYGKALLGIRSGLEGNELIVFMQTEINNEIIKN